MDWPLTDKENNILDDNQAVLVDILDTCDLLNRLYSEGVINKWQKTFIETKPSYFDKNEALIDIVRRLSRANYCKLIKCLSDSNQDHIADIFENGGGKSINLRPIIINCLITTVAIVYKCQKSTIAYHFDITVE